ncbi:small, acid-soluble spore protein, H family [Alkaliphilus pronyensis]|uniref:Small, acid-soluble spore protein, H family n=1 Tax=Alkaliphilus pronyensis TaxID=1482732 RepID=A0A6I0EXU8_9FIRM|nr:H-type small acid-soluble spore protein [Alkaliphilus pronyensis]KAB3534091.1 small, acid-soluble spore protein, H family [Alkaliphilus pronyensis]
MDMKRANEIFNASNPIPVHYNGKSIWIAELNHHKETAKIKESLFSHEIKEVPVKELVE